MKPEMIQKREELKALSRVMQQAVKSGMYESVNEGLAAMYAEQGHTELHSYRQWKERGWQVRRGEKALLLWGQPRTAQNHKRESDEDKDEFSFYPLAFVFSNQQVEPAITPHMAS